MKYKWLPRLNAIILPLIPLLYLYNKNTQYLYFPQILILWGILGVVSWILYESTSRIFLKSIYGLIMSTTWLVLIFSHRNIINSILPNGIYYSMLLLASEPFISFIFTYILYQFIKRFDVENFIIPFAVFLLTLLILNISNFVISQSKSSEFSGEVKVKENFNIDRTLPNPNIYWLFADGMLGFDAMEKYFNYPQNSFRQSLNDRGFVINSSANFESGHATRISIPVLMSPDYYDTYLNKPLSNHEGAMQLREGTDYSLFEARINNELIKAFDLKSYTTIAMSLNESNFVPITDLFYYVHHIGTTGNIATEPILVKKPSVDDGFKKNTIYAKNLADLFLGELCHMFTSYYIRSANRIEIPLSTQFEETSSVLLGSDDAKVYSSLIKSIYDALYSNVSKEPKLTIIHNMMAHSPFTYNENGIMSERKSFFDITNYPQHHVYTAKVTINIIDMILEADENAVIILQADHGLHTLSAEAINEGLSTHGAEVEIWNSVISAIRIPNRYTTAEIEYVNSNPKNISRFLVNSYVGDNYDYILSD